MFKKKNGKEWFRENIKSNPDLRRPAKTTGWQKRQKLCDSRMASDVAESTDRLPRQGIGEAQEVSLRSLGHHRQRGMDGKHRVLGDKRTEGRVQFYGPGWAACTRTPLRGARQEKHWQGMCRNSQRQKSLLLKNCSQVLVTKSLAREAFPEAPKRLLKEKVKINPSAQERAKTPAHCPGPQRWDLSLFIPDPMRLTFPLQVGYVIY